MRSSLALFLSVYSSVCISPQAESCAGPTCVSSNGINKIQLEIVDSVFADMIQLTILYHPLDSNKGNGEKRKIGGRKKAESVAQGQAPKDNTITSCMSHYHSSAKSVFFMYISVTR